MKNILYIFLLYFLTACSSYKEQKLEIVKEFLTEVSLEHSEIETPPVLFNVGQIIMLDSVLITIDMKASPFFRIFLLPDFLYVGGFVQKGAGPGEEVDIDPFIHGLSGNTFLYKSLKSVKIVDFNLKQNKIEILENKKLPGKLLGFSHIFMLPDSLLGGWNVNQNSNKEFLKYNPKTKTILEFGPNYSKIIKDVPPQMEASIFSKIVTVRPNRTAFAAVYDKFQMLRIFSTDGILLKEVRFKDSPKLPKGIIIGDFRAITPDEIIMHYQKIYSTNKYIYALYSGKSLSKISPENNGIVDICDEIHVWNWEGNPIVKISLDKNFFSFTVSSDDSYIICSSSESLDRLYMYNLDILK